MKIIANELQIEVADSAEENPEHAARPVVLLIMGLGMQLIAWPPAMVQGLVDAGFRVLRFDNRDLGLSQHFDHLKTPNLLWAGLKYRMGWRIKPPYTMQDMADDALGVLDAFQIGRAHVVGVSMGGMIAQRMALVAPGRVCSLTSVMSSSGARGLPAATAKVSGALLNRPAGKSLQDEIDHSVKLFQLIGSPGFPTDAALLRARVVAAAERSRHPQGLMRQMVAVAADAQRAESLSRITTPTLVVHGKADPLVPFACGEDTARRIPGARLSLIAGMGHDLAPGVIDRLLPLLLAHFEAASASTSSP